MIRRGFLHLLGLAPVAAPMALAAATTAPSREAVLRGMTSAFINVPYGADLSGVRFEPGMIERLPRYEAVNRGLKVSPADLKFELVEAYRELEAIAPVVEPDEDDEPSWPWLCGAEDTAPTA